MNESPGTREYVLKQRRYGCGLFLLAIGTIAGLCAASAYLGEGRNAPPPRPMSPNHRIGYETAPQPVPTSIVRME